MRLPAPIPNLLRRILPGMVARGHGIDALCLYLDLARTALLDLMVELDLPTPHDRPLRKPGGRNPWTFADTTLFIVLWMAGWHPDSLGERFGRSAGGARYKARHLGLPRRERKQLFRPPRPGEDLPSGILQGLRPEPASTRDDEGQQGFAVRTTPAADDDIPAAGDPQDPATAGTYSYSGSTALCALDASTLTPTILPFPAFSDADLFGPTPVGTPPVRTPKRRQVAWTRERDKELAQRVWARQHYKAIARDMGVSPSTVQSRRRRLGLPSFVDEKDLAFLRPDDLVDEFDPSVVAVHIAAADYVERRCSAYGEDGKEFWFWAPRFANHKSKEYERLEERRRNRRPAPPRPRRNAGVPLRFASDPWGDAEADTLPMPHPATLPTPFAPPPAMIGA